jgi:splicing factor, arginine/serine-rich 16
MWHEARKHEKKIRGIMNDFYKRRSERRKQFYDIVVSFQLISIEELVCMYIFQQKTDPMRFLQLHGSKCRIHYDGVENEEAQM